MFKPKIWLRLGALAVASSATMSSKPIHAAESVDPSKAAVGQYDSAGTVVYKMDLHEGPQFRMGTLNTKGFPPSEAKMLSSKWELKSGDIFDEGYGMEFSKKNMGTILRGIYQQRSIEGRPAPQVKWNTHINRETTTVDVSVELVN